MRKNIIFIIAGLTFLIFFEKNNILCAYSENNFSRKPTLTSKNFDNRVTKIIIKYIENDQEKIQEIGTGFFITDAKNFIYLVSAGHVFREALKILLDKKGKMIFCQKFEDKDAKVQEIVNYDIDIIDYWKKGLLKFNDDSNIDVGMIRLREFIKKEQPLIIQEKEESEATEKSKKLLLMSVCVDILSNDEIAKYEDIEKAEDVYFFGYPTLPTLVEIDKTHSLNSIIRKGIVSKLIDGKKIIIDGFVSGGNSGSPVFLRRELLKEGQIKIELRFIGMVTKYFPYYIKKVYPKSEESEILIKQETENSGLGLIESLDNIRDTLKEFSIEEQKKEEIPAKDILGKKD